MNMDRDNIKDATEPLTFELIAEDITKAVSAAIEYSAKFGASKYKEEQHARCQSEYIHNPPIALVHDVFEGLPITPVEFALARQTAN